MPNNFSGCDDSWDFEEFKKVCFNIIFPVRCILMLFILFIIY
jgi:hypothetical protein